jgi:hypothetical protein
MLARAVDYGVRLPAFDEVREPTGLDASDFELAS